MKLLFVFFVVGALVSGCSSNKFDSVDRELVEVCRDKVTKKFVKCP